MLLLDAGESKGTPVSSISGATFWFDDSKSYILL